MQSGDLASYYNNLSQALFGYLGDKLEIQTADFTLDKAIAKLISSNMNENFVEKIKKVSERCEFARFAPSAVGSDSSGELFNSVESMIQEIESIFKIKK